jgi:hypothetical protein
MKSQFQVKRKDHFLGSLPAVHQRELHPDFYPFEGKLTGGSSKTLLIKKNIL